MRRSSVSLVIRRSSPVSRVADSTREAVLTASPMAVKSSLPPPPIVPTTTEPELIPRPTLWLSL